MRTSFFPKDFLKETFTLALPIAFQALINSAVNLIDVVMLGKLGDADIAAAGCANQIFFLLTMVLFGTCTGASVFMAQFWGKRDVDGVHRTMGMMGLISLAASLLFTLGAMICPRPLIEMYSGDEEVIAKGAEYLRIVGASYIVTALSFAMGYACRATGNVRLPMLTSLLSVFTNTSLNLVLIFGLLGFPALGLRGAAIATSIARYVEFLVLFAVVYIQRTPVAASFKQLFCHLDRAFAARYFKTALPVFINETLWSIGISLNTVAYGMLGTSALAAVQIGDTVSKLFMVLTRGLSDACAIRTGHLIGAGDNEGALRDSTRFLVLIPLMSTVMCALLYLFRPQILTFFDVTPETRVQAMEMLALQALRQIPCAFNNTIIVGLCRSGGDTVFACILDTATVWLVGVPLSFLGVYLGFPLWGVCLCVMMGDLVKSAVGLPRILSKKWLHNVVADPA